jgi:hypothetical protein
VRRALWIAPLALLVALQTSAEVRRVEVVGVAPAGADARPDVPARQAALEAALTQGVERVARQLLSEESAGDPDLDLGRLLGADVRDFTLGYRVLEDRGERRALLLADPQVSTEYVLLVEVEVDVSRLESTLKAAGLRLREPAEGASRELRVVVEPLPSYRAYLSLRRHLEEAAGVRSAIPALFDSERVELQVDAQLTPQELMNRLVSPPPEGLRVEPLFADGRSVWIRLIELPGAPED